MTGIELFVLIGGCYAIYRSWHGPSQHRLTTILLTKKSNSSGGENMQKLLDAVVEQIRSDVTSGDLTAVEELIRTLDYRSTAELPTRRSVDKSSKGCFMT